MKRRSASRGASSKYRLLKQRYELLMGAINEGVYDWNVVDDTIYYSDSVQKAVGLPPALLKTTADWRNRIHPDDLPRYLAAIVEHFKGGTPRFQCDYRYRTLEGSWRWARQHGVAVRARNGRVRRLVGATGDITELKQAEEALAQSEQRYVLATTAAAEGIYEWDLQSGRLFVTERARTLFRLPDGELTPGAWNSRIHGEDFAGYRQAIIEHFKGRAPQLEHEYRLADGQGGYRWVLERGIGVRNAAGRVVKMVGALGDITRRKRAQIELQRARDAAQEALEQQTATADILKAMSGSPTDTRPVFEAIVQSGLRLFPDAAVLVRLTDGAEVPLVAIAHQDPAHAEQWRKRAPVPLTREYLQGLAILDHRIVEVPDAELHTDPSVAPGLRNFLASGYRAVTLMPMIRGDTAIGTVGVARLNPGPLTERQISLLRTFADQAVIAIENVRLFNETKEALEQQTGTAEILEITARSPSDVQPVFEAIARNAVRLCGGAHCAVFRFDGRLQHFAAHCDVDPETVGLLRRLYPRPPDPARVSGRAILESEVIHLEDALSDARFPGSAETLTTSGSRAVLAVPMLKAGGPIGVIFMVRRDPRRFSERQVALLKTFADQAVIAIENARLFNETREALEQQKALAEVLGSISSSIADTKPVFDRILDSCQRLFEGHLVGLTLTGEDGRVRLGAYQGENKEAMAAVYPYPLGRDSGSGQAILDRKVVHFPDVHAPGSDAPPRVLAGAQAAGFKAIIFAPLLDEGHGIGALWVGRRLPGPFSERQIALLQSFADQAVIAIRNARLFSEIREKSRQLETANRHKSQFLANMSHELRTPLNAIIGFARIVARHSEGRVEPKQLENLDKIQASGQHLLALINAILDLSKVEAGRVEVQPSEVALAPVLEQCLRTIEPLVRVSLVREFNGALPSMYVDEEKLRQIVLNLLSNAAKFTERGTIRLKAQVADGAVAIAVADTGMGIPGDKLGLIFAEFEQVDASIKRSHGGTGLGLAIAQRLARLMGGDIGVESTLGGGSTFTLTLPLRYSA